MRARIHAAALAAAVAQVHVSSDGGATWAERGSLGGQSEALAASGVLASTDGGRTWTVRYSDAAER